MMSACCNGVIQACSYAPGFVIAELPSESRELVSVFQFDASGKYYACLDWGPPDGY